MTRSGDDGSMSPHRPNALRGNTAVGPLDAVVNIWSVIEYDDGETYEHRRFCGSLMVDAFLLLLNVEATLRPCAVFAFSSGSIKSMPCLHLWLGSSYEKTI